MPDIAGIHHVSITVTDIEKSVAWYQRVLGVERLLEEKHPDGNGYAVILGKPDFSVCVGLHTHPTNEKERFAEDRTGLDHVGFLVSGYDDLHAWEARLAALGVEHSPVNIQGRYGVVVFRDPDNVQLEFFAFGAATG